MPRLAIIGLGLIGASIGLALKRADIKGLEISGFDIEYGVGGKARKRGAIDVDARSIPQAVDGAAIVVVATPISQVKETFETLAASLGEGATVTDTASAKGDVIRWANELLPDYVTFVGGHPIAGSEKSGVDAADAGLFQGRAWALTPGVHAHERALRAIETLITIMGAQPVIIDPAEHDSYMAAMSHVPLIAATALFSLARESQAWQDLGVLAGPGFRDTTRLASTNPSLSHDICLTNRENLLHWLDRYIEELRRYRNLITDETQQQLYQAFVRTAVERDTFIQHPPRREPPAGPGDDTSAGERMLSFMVGEFLVRRTKEIERMVERRAENGGSGDPKRR
jgi:prephenate dehydrogenase